MFRMKITDTLHVDVLVARISKKKRIWKKIWREIKTHFHLIQYHSISQILVMVTQNQRNIQCIWPVSMSLHLSGVFSCIFIVFNRQQRYITFTGHAFNWNNTGFDLKLDQQCKYKCLLKQRQDIALPIKTNGKVTFHFIETSDVLCYNANLKSACSIKIIFNKTD